MSHSNYFQVYTVSCEVKAVLNLCEPKSNSLHFTNAKF
jgi:hypothetical protein